MNKLFASSINPEKLSLTVKGILGGIATFVVSLAVLFGVNITQGDFQMAINGVGDFIVAIGAVISTAMVIYGGIRKIVVAFRKPPTQ